MDRKLIVEALEKGTQVAFGPCDTPHDVYLYGIQGNITENTVMFTSDGLDFAQDRTWEEIMELIYAEFKIARFQIDFHVHPGTWHDKDCTIRIPDGQRDKEMMVNLIDFIVRTCYSNTTCWSYKVIAP